MYVQILPLSFISWVILTLTFFSLTFLICPPGKVQ